MFGITLQIIIALVYILSGLLKLQDPVGTGLIVEAYLRFMHLNDFMGYAKALGVMLGFVETAIGLAVFCSIWQKVVKWMLVAMQSVFTVISLILLVRNPEMHCGCFGEAIHLTHLQTFIKNLILMAMVLHACFSDRMSRRKEVWKHYAFGCSIVLVLAVTLYSWFNLPLIDFTDYDKGTKLLSQAGYRMLPDSEKEDCMPLPMLSPEDNLLPDFSKGKWAIISVYDQLDWQVITTMHAELIRQGMNVMILITTDVITNDIDLDENTNDIFLTDRTTALSLNRSNGGVTLLDEGVIKRKVRCTLHNTNN